jgi:hypothetical protein
MGSQLHEHEDRVKPVVGRLAGRIDAELAAVEEKIKEF